MSVSFDPEGLSSVQIVFGSIDLVREIILFLSNDSVHILILTGVSKSFQGATLDSSQVWRLTCRVRWSKKWGFADRWKRAERDSLLCSSSQSPGKWWRDRFFLEEADSKRASITDVEELCSFVWDMRFWLTDFLENERNILQSGLRWSASSKFRFGSSPRGDNEQRHDGLSGIIRGHPSERTDLEWFLDDDGKEIQWGRLPYLWPKAGLVRLENWGWEIRNPNVCLRAIDTDTDNGTICKMWDDYLQSVKYHRVMVWPRLEEGEIMIEVPTQFFSFPQNRLRFPGSNARETELV